VDNVGVVVLGVTDVTRAADFWQAALGYPEDPDFVVLADPDGNRFCIVDLSHDRG
jgi:hypothetical protein